MYKDFRNFLQFYFATLYVPNCQLYKKYCTVTLAVFSHGPQQHMNNAALGCEKLRDDQTT